MTAHVTERVVADHRQVAQRVGVLGLEGRDLLPQPVHVLGQGIHTLATGASRRTTQREQRQHAGQGGEDDGGDGEEQHAPTL